jgi:heparin binding hemagglutinin HbhA
MAIVNEIRKSVSESTPLLAVVGAGDLAVERVRHAVANASTIQAEVEARVTRVQAGLEKSVAAFDPAALQAAITARMQKAFDRATLASTVQQVPALAVARALEAAGHVEQGYEGLAERGKQLVNRLSHQKATQDLLAQGKVTLTRTKAAVTTARKAVDETTTAAKSAVTVGRRESGEAVAEVEKAVAETEKVVAARTRATRSAVQRTTTTARTRATATRGAAKGAVTSARKTAKAVEKAVEAGAAKIGD